MFIWLMSYKSLKGSYIFSYFFVFALIGWVLLLCLWVNWFFLLFYLVSCWTPLVCFSVQLLYSLVHLWKYLYTIGLGNHWVLSYAAHTILWFHMDYFITHTNTHTHKIPFMTSPWNGWRSSGRITGTTSHDLYQRSWDFPLEPTL